MNWNKIKDEIDSALKENGLDDETTFSHIHVYDSATKLDIYFSDDGLLCVEGKEEK